MPPARLKAVAARIPTERLEKSSPYAGLRHQEAVTAATTRNAKKDLAAFGAIGTTFDRLAPSRVLELTKRFLVLMENPCITDGIRMQSLKDLLREAQGWAR